MLDLVAHEPLEDAPHGLPVVGRRQAEDDRREEVHVEPGPDLPDVHLHEVIDQMVFGNRQVRLRQRPAADVGQALLEPLAGGRRQEPRKRPLGQSHEEV